MVNIFKISKTFLLIYKDRSLGAHDWREARGVGGQVGQLCLDLERYEGDCRVPPAPPWPSESLRELLPLELRRVS